MTHAPRHLAALAVALASMIGIAGPAHAADPVRLVIKDQRFSPSEVTVPGHRRFRIEVFNQDATPAEFDSSDLRVEKIIPTGRGVTIMIGPLRPGTYRFTDEFHSDTAEGTITAVR